MLEVSISVGLIPGMVIAECTCTVAVIVIAKLHLLRVHNSLDM